MGRAPVPAVGTGTILIQPMRRRKTVTLPAPA